MNSKAFAIVAVLSVMLVAAPAVSQECHSNAECAAEMYCKKSPGDCIGMGECAVKPLGCPDVWDPVCGCNGQTYGNECDAAAAGVSVAHEGECIADLQCADDGNCDDGMYCEKPVGECDGTGLCVSPPLGCPDHVDPVCGCDGVTYFNPCEAQAAGVSIDHYGECGIAACESNDDCDDNFYCEKDIGDCDGDGVCAEMPLFCTEEYNPVCGCDGVTHDNPCYAAAAGASILHFGVCDAGECVSNDDCNDNFYCKKEIGDCNGIGVCAERPLGCPDVWDPVCGCNGQTYSNDCDAAAAGVNIAHLGECRVGTCLSNDDCTDDFYCKKDIGDCNGIGVCAERPLGCPDVWDPVCGCDGKTYSNDCDAAAAGVSIAHLGKCEFETCIDDSQCDTDYWCAKPIGQCNGTGQCAPVTDGFCILLYDPVCGCDGKTYSNACFADLAQVNIAHLGECDDDPPSEPCTSNDDCEDAEYCKKPAGECDAEGTCQPRPLICPQVYAPVCGCNGVTYSNSCYAASNGISIAHEGECKEPGTDCNSNADCPDGSYCAGECDGAGTCQVMPEFCILIYDPVCGCDGVTYSNACFAAGAGVNVLHPGYCIAGSGAKGCANDTECPQGMWCSTEPGDCGGPGSCATLVDAATIDCFDVWLPVCGCDGRTYSNDCYVYAANVSITHEGECDAPLPCTGDLTGDGSVGVPDLLELLGAWGPCPLCPADLTGDGTVGVPDLLELLANWGECPE